MKFIDDPELARLSAALDYRVNGIVVTGGIELYSTRAASSDKRLYKALDKTRTTSDGNASPVASPVTIMSPPASSCLMAHSFSNSFTSMGSLTLASTLASTVDDEGAVNSIDIDHGMDGASNVAINAGLPVGPNSHPMSPANVSGTTVTIVGSHHHRRLSNALGTSVSTLQQASSPFGPLTEHTSLKVFASLISVLNASDPDHDFSSLDPHDFAAEPSATMAMNAFNNALLNTGMPVPPRLWDVVDSLVDVAECRVYSHTPPPHVTDDDPNRMWTIMYFFLNKHRKRLVYAHLTAHRPTRRHRRRSRGTGVADSDQSESDYDHVHYSPSSYEDDDYEDEQVVGGLEMD